jgi:acetyl esterase/lipase
MALRKVFKGQHLTVAGYRARSARTSRLMDRIPKDVVVKTVEIDGTLVEWVFPPDNAQERVILYLHGGGYVTDSVASRRPMCIQMAKSLTMTVLQVEYRLAPEHPFPAALEDALKVYRWLLTQGHKPSDIIISGDSAGGGLGVATVLALRDAGEPLPAAVVCLSPWVDLTHRGQSHITKAEAECVLRTDVLKEWALCYADGSRLSDPLVSPVYADFHGFPPLLIQVGGDEILLDDSLSLAEKAKAAGVDVTFRVWDGMWHAWLVLANLIPESRMAFDDMGVFLCTHLVSSQ